MSPTRPTISAVASPSTMRRPTGSSPGKNCAASASLTITTGGLSGVSRPSKRRPARSGMRSASK
jgi:hypothetical protein